MERLEILEMMSTLKLSGMRPAYDEVVTNGIKRQHSVARIIGDLLKAEIAEKQARSVRYQIAAAHLPLAKELAQFDFTGTPVNAALVQVRAIALFDGVLSAVFDGLPATASRLL